jgi:hypothetical protein
VVGVVLVDALRDLRVEQNLLQRRVDDVARQVAGREDLKEPQQLDLQPRAWGAVVAIVL